MSIDLLSDVLAMVRLTGALVFRVDIEGPWGVAGRPTVENFAPLLPSGTNQVIVFHLVLDGECWFRHASRDWFAVPRGHAVVMAHGDAHDLGDAPHRHLLPFSAMLGGGSLLDVRHACFKTGSGRSTSLLCGFLGCDRHAFEPLLLALPPIFCTTLDAQLDTIVRYALADALDDRPGSASLRVRLAELMFMEILRTHMRALPRTATGWLAGLRDPVVGRALGALHGAPAAAWTVEELARTVASSRSRLASRFNELIGEPPMRYLARLRMQLAARHLGEGMSSVAAVAEAVGYGSSAAFQRAFKRHFGTSPGHWRRSQAQRGPAASSGP